MFSVIPNYHQVKQRTSFLGYFFLANEAAFDTLCSR